MEETMKYIFTLIILLSYNYGSLFGMSEKDIQIVIAIEKSKVNISPRDNISTRDNISLRKPTVTDSEEVFPNNSKINTNTNNDSNLSENQLYDKLLDKSLKDNKKLVVWVNYNNNPIENNLKEMNHIHMSKFVDSEDLTPRIVIGIPYNNIMARYNLDIDSITIDKIRAANFFKYSTVTPTYDVEVYPESFGGPSAGFRSEFYQINSGKNCYGGG